jgi:retinol dehydrogenase 12
MKIRMEGKTCLITGATSGIGFETAQALAAAGAKVIGVGRNPARCAAAEAVLREAGDGTARCLEADMSSMAQVRALAARVASTEERLDVLVNNAGTFSMRRRTSAEGIELQFAVNHLSGFLLTRELLPLLQAAPSARVIGLSSGSHFTGRIHWGDVGLKGRYFGLTAYDQSKLAVLLFCVELARRLGAGSSVAAYAADPGLVKTEIGRKGTGAFVRLFWNLRTRGGIGAEEAASWIAFLASDPSVEARTGLYWKEGKPMPSSPLSRDAEAARRLWDLSERMCGEVRPLSRRTQASVPAGPP